MRLRLLTFFSLFLSFAGLACAQTAWFGASDHATAAPAPYANSSVPSYSAVEEEVLPAAVAVLPRMAPDLALQAFRGRAVLQAAGLSSYSAHTVIHADLPDTRQSGEYELQRQYSAPHQLTFKAVRFTGDNFVKSNVIVRVLQSEVDHVQKGDAAANAITPANYKFSYKGTTELQGRTVHVYQIKPRKNRAELFKGRIYLDVYSGSIVRAEGKLVKTPSLFVKNVEFVQDYADIDSFTFPTHIHSEATARIIGRAIVDIYHSDYQPVSNVAQAKASPAL